mgnify:CR=1 FL=1
MNQNISIYELTRKVERFCEQRDWNQFHNPKDLAIGISTEANELLDIFRFKTDEQMRDMFIDEVSREKIEDEIADVLFFVLRFAQMNDLDLEKCIDHKLEKNALKYAVEKCKGKNLKYNEI